MSNHQKLRAILKKMSGQDNVVTIPRIFVEYLDGDLTTALVLNQLVFFSDKTKRKDGYFFKTYNEWEEETGLSKRRVKYSIDKLAKLELVQTKRKKAYGAPTVHYALDYDKMLDSIMTKCMVSSEQNVTNPESDKVSQSLTDDLQMNSTDELNSSSNSSADDQQALGKVFQFYDNNFGGTMSDYHRDFLGGWSDTLSPEIVHRALEETVLQGGHNLKYVTRILNDWHKANCKTIEDVDKHEEAKQNQRRSTNGRAQTRHAGGHGPAASANGTGQGEPLFGNGRFKPKT